MNPTATKWRAFAAIALTYVTIVFASSMSFLVLTAISDEFGVTLGVVAWVVIIEALIVGADVAFVVAHHVLRMVIVILGAPVAARVFRPKPRD